MIYLGPTRAAATFICALLLLPPMAHKVIHIDPAYAPVVTQEDRAEGKFGYTPYPNFPHIELVREGTGQAEKDLTALITDQPLRDSVNRGDFKSLQVRNFTPRLSAVTRSGDDVVIPFALSLRQYAHWLTQGTLDLEGRLTVYADGRPPLAEIFKYFDSIAAEHLARVYWLHERDNLAFAKAIAESQLTHWLRADPSRLPALVQRAGAAGALPRP